MRSILWIAVVMLVAGCASATLPPAQSVTDLKVLAGTYSGWVGSTQVKLVIGSDGKYEAQPYQGQGRHVTGSIWLVGNQLNYESSFPSKGTATYYTDGTKRVIRFTRSDTGVVSEWTASK